MRRRSGSLLTVLAAWGVLASSAGAAEPGTPLPPPIFSTLSGCWQGQGDVAGKPVSITLRGRFILQDAMFSIDVESVAKKAPHDRYTAHLLFGGTDKGHSADVTPVAGFWSDSFGGAHMTTGHGAARPGGLDMTYAYPDMSFTNRWTITKSRVDWEIVSTGKDGSSQPFARYTLRHTCTEPVSH